MVQECIENCNEMITYMTSTVTKLPTPLQTTCLDHLEACFNTGQWWEPSLKQNRVVEYKVALQDHYRIKYNGKFAIKNVCDQVKLDHSFNPSSGLRALESTTIFDQFLVNVTWVNDPGCFYIVPISGKQIRNMIISATNQAASSYQLSPQQIVYENVYAVRNDGGNWIRGLCGKRCGITVIGDNPPETHYELFCLDQGYHEEIGLSNVRVLPPEIQRYPAQAQECTLHEKFQHVPWSSQATNYFNK